MSTSEILRGKPRIEIRRKAMRQKFMFAAALLGSSDTLTDAAKAAGVLPQQIRRWRTNDPRFNIAINGVEALLSGNYSSEDEYQEIVAQVRSYMVGLKRELKSSE